MVASMGELGPGPEVSQVAKDQEWERKQRNREYRVAARREKRNRKADEKKQRKLNATILRRMTRNPDKYNKNAERNRLRDIEGERRRIWQEAVRQAQRLAAIHDPSGASFNIGPVVVQEDGTVICQETLRRREERSKEKAALQTTKENTQVEGDLAAPTPFKTENVINAPPILPIGFNPDRLAKIEATKSQQPPPSRLSKTQQKKRAALEPRPPPPKPTMPDNITVPEGEENWLDLWDLTDDQLEKRVLREKKRKAADRKALRVKQQSGKAERRIARDEKRKVYRDIKLTWKAIKEEQVRERTKLKSMEDEESKKIAVDINVMERKAALDHCAALGFNLANTPGVDEVKPRALGMRGVEVDFEAIEIGESRSDVKPKQNVKRVDLGNAPEEAKAEYVPTGQGGDDDGDVEEFIHLDVGEGQDFETLNYNHKLRRKLRRAIDNAEIRKEMLVRQRAVDYYREKDSKVPPVLTTPYKPINVKGQRIMDNGRFETAKQERVRARLELAEFNTQMRVLRKQAKDAAIYAGLRKHAELMGRISASENTDTMSALENSLTAVPSRHASKPTKRSRTENDDSSSGDSEDLSDKSVDASSLSDTSSDAPSSLSGDGRRANKRQRLESGTSNKQSESTNSDRQAMIDAESARTESKYQNHKKPLNRSGSLEEVDGNVEKKFRRAGLGKGANSISTMNGDTARKTKFLKLLGGEKSTPKANFGELKDPGVPPNHSAQINAVLEKQYEDSMAYRKASHRKGLGS